MAEQGIFGPTPEQLAELRRQQTAERSAMAARVSPSYSAGFGVGNLLSGVVGTLFNIQDPAIAKASKIQSVLKEVNSSLTDEERANPALQYARVAQRFAQEDGLQNEAMQAQQMAADLGMQMETRQADIASKRATAFKAEQDAMLKQQDYLREEQGRAALLKAAETKGSPLTSEETIQILSTYLPPEKLVPLLQTSQDKAAYRDAMLGQANIMAESRVAAAEARNASAKELEEIRQQNRIELKKLEAQLKPAGGSKVSVYERGYANQFVTSANELVPASQNLNILTNGGVSPVTAGIFTGLKGNGFLNSTGSALGNTMTPTDAQQYESIMLPVIQNIGTLQNAGRRTTIAQLENLKQALIAKPGQSYTAQLQKMGELRQIVEAASEAAMANPALSDEQKAQVQGSVAKLQQFIPFTGTDVAKFSQYAKKNPNVQFKDWLKVNGSQAGSNMEKTVARTGKVTTGPNVGKTVVEYSDGTREYK